MMEQQAEDDQKASQTPPSKRTKQHQISRDSIDNQLTIVTTRTSSNLIDINMQLPEALLNQQSVNRKWHSELYKLLLRDDSNMAPEENLEPLIAGLKSFWTRELWHKALEEEQAIK